MTSNLSYFTIDLETTGTRPGFHEITEIAIIRHSDLVQYIWDVKIKYPERADPRALEVTNTTVSKLLSRGKYIEEVIPDVNAFIEEDGITPEQRVMVGHNVSFDKRMAKKAWEMNGFVFPALFFECTLAMSRRYVKINKLNTKCKLEEIIHTLGIKGELGYHSAAVDTRNTFKLRNFLIKNGIDELQFIKADEDFVKKIKEKDEKEEADKDLEDDPAMKEFF
jgi:DNA polymerase III epsilon subunit-like protein